LASPAFIGVVDLECIISGGQTGADRAALDWAMANGMPHAGWCPLGRLAEDGPIAPHYQLRETPGAEYLQRTEWNVRNADATMILSLTETLAGGSLATAELAAAMGKPWRHISATDGDKAAEKHLRAFLQKHRPRILNIAGPRASGEPEVGEFVRATLDAALVVDKP